MIALAEKSNVAGEAFDTIADAYDSLFTASVIGRSQRSVVWEKAAVTFRPGDRVLELNCGTGEDALFLTSKGIFVTACDASSRMIEMARRKAAETPSANVEFHMLSIERLAEMPSARRFDGAFSNFSGLNCVRDLAAVSWDLAVRLEAGASLLLCFSTRFCVWEMLRFLFRGEPRRAFRRWGGKADASLGPRSFPVYYPSLRLISKRFQPMFRLRSVIGVGIAVPPSYMEDWACRHPRLFTICETADRFLRRCPGIRVLGDHMLLHFERV